MTDTELGFINRNITLYGMINDETARDIVYNIKAINDYDDLVDQAQLDMFGDYIQRGVLKSDAVKGLESREPIIIEINSGGGYSSAGFAIINAIENSETPIIGHVTGDCMSMAIAVFASCHYRLSSRLSSFMIHDIHSASEGKFNDMISAIGYMKQVRKNYKDLLLEYTNLEEDKLTNIVDANSDYYFTPQEAVEMGLADAIDNEEIDEALLIKKLYGVELKEEPSDVIDDSIDDSNMIKYEKEDELGFNLDDFTLEPLKHEDKLKVDNYF